MKKAFTLIELMVVVMVLGVVTAVIIPNFSVFMRGNRMRLSVKSVILAGKYAKSVAVLQQKDTAIVFDFDLKTVSVNFISPKNPTVNAFEEDDLVDFEQNELGDFETIVPTPKSSVGEKLQGIDVVERNLEDGIVFDSVDINLSVIGEEVRREHSEGICSVVYYTNGRCEPYIVSLRRDEDSETAVTISVDALGFVETVYDE
jgi:prepilin-type N-terminal cleavage/methylation domain-containing protein